MPEVHAKGFLSETPWSILIQKKRLIIYSLLYTTRLLSGIAHLENANFLSKMSYKIAIIIQYL